MIELVLGGTRSGKSHYAQQQALISKKPVVYIATATPKDSEMCSRIVRHQHNRPTDWQTLEEPIQLAKTIKNQGTENTCLLVDCLTLWLSNIMFNVQGKLQQTLLEQETQALYDVLSTFSGQLILVSNEVGSGVVSVDTMTRRFVDEAGLLHQQIALLSHRVVLVTAGLPCLLK